MARVRRQDTLIQTGLALFSTRPYDEILIDDIAAAAGMSKGLLYYYYPTKRDFYVAVLRYAAEELLTRTHIDEGLDPLTRVREGVDEYLKYVQAHAPTYIALLRGGMGGDAEIAAISNGVRRANTERALREFSAADQVSPALHLAVAGWLGTVEAMSLAWLQDGLGTREQVCDLCVRAFFSALRDARALDETLALTRYRPYI